MDEAAEIERALRLALHRMAPLGGERRLGVNATAAALMGLLADLLAGATPPTPDEVERLAALFRAKLTDALAERAERGGGRRH